MVSLVEALVKVLLATSWGTICGIAEHSNHLIEAVREADPTIEVQPCQEALNPDYLGHVPGVDLIHLNYHRALHSRWTPGLIQPRHMGRFPPLVITFHDTFGELPPDALSADLCDLADAFIVHEPCQGLEKALYWRMGVPEPTGQIAREHGAHRSRPILGTVGFPFPWKNLPRMAKSAADAGWGLLILCPSMDPDQEVKIREQNRWVEIRRGLSDQEVRTTLATCCDATAFTFTCANSGQSASILQGVGARKPVIAFDTCRQFRALHEASPTTIQWCQTFEDVTDILGGLSLDRFDSGMVALAEQESWRHLGKKYADLYRRLGGLV